ncbi:MAG TPA: hypothetical protein VHE37_10295, partial [Nevskiaceae bacterium]|nr:hypothetical protein [Nevskiaceae bacterium]
MNPLMLVFVATLLLVGTAVFLLLRASERDKHDDVQLRLRVLGGDDAAAAMVNYQPRDAKLTNPLLRAACRLVWRTGAEVEPDTVS